VRFVALAAFLSTAAPALAATVPTDGQAAEAGATMSAAGGAKKVAYGKRVRFAGAVSSSAAGKGVRLEYAPNGTGWRPLAQARTAANGTYSVSVRAKRSGLYRAVGASGPSAARKLDVGAHVKARATRHVLGQHKVRVRGRLKPGVRGRSVHLQRAVHRRWKTVDRTRTRAGGRFRAAFHPRRVGSYRLRVRFRGDGANAASNRKLRPTYVYRAGQASFYGPGLYGGHLACGGTLTPGTIGVASKRLPCGTKVKFHYHGRSVTAPVIDRGPYAAGRDWDLTAATKNKLGFGSTGTVWSTK
jgi:rare lipoprotein A